MPPDSPPQGPSPLAERFWSLAEAAERGVVVDRSGPVGVVRHVLEILGAFEAGRNGAPVALSTHSFLAELDARTASGDLSSIADSETAADPAERALVFSIGVLLFEGLTGRHPLGAVEGPRRLGRLSTTELEVMVRRASEVPAALCGVLVRAMGPDHAERFTSMAALRAELEWFVVAEAENAANLTVPISVPIPPSDPPVMVAAHAHEPTRKRSAEVELETAMIPRTSLEELNVGRDRRIDSIDRMVMQPFDDRHATTGETNLVRRRNSSADERNQPRRFEPRKRQRETLRLVLITLLLMLLGAAITTLSIQLFRTRD